MTNTKNTKNYKYFLYYSELPVIPSDWQFIELTKIKKIKKAKEILIMDLLDFVDTNQKLQLCQDIYNSLNKDGVLLIQGEDIYSLSAAVLNHQIDMQTFNNLLFRSHRQSASSMGSTISLLKEAGFVILEAKFINGIQYSIKCGKAIDA